MDKSFDQLEEEVEASGKTAIKRNAISAPVRKLLELDLLKGSVLDYGCGRGDDVRYLGIKEDINVHGYDVNHYPYREYMYFYYDVVLCTYVINTLESIENRLDVLCSVLDLCDDDGGAAYITVRRDCKTGKTSRGTWQCGEIDVIAEAERIIKEYSFYCKWMVESLYKCSRFEIYKFYQDS